MSFETIVWDLEDDEDGNYWHIVVKGHGVSRAEVEEVLLDPGNQQGIISRTSGNPMTFGWTSAGQYIVVVWELISDDPRAIYPLTAYPVPPPGGSRP